MKNDILSRMDIHTIISKFYEKLLEDEKMKPFFEEIIEQNHLENHLDIITDFWSDILFDTHLYANNVMQKHLHKNAEMTFEKVHFERWASYFITTIDASFKGMIASKMKERALSISTIMQVNILYQ